MASGDEGENKRLIGNRMRSCGVKQSVRKRGEALVRWFGADCRGKHCGNPAATLDSSHNYLPPPPRSTRHADTSGTRVIGELTRPPALHNSNNKDTTSLPVRGPGHCVALVRPAQRPLLVGWRLATGDRNKCSSEDTRTQCNCQAASCQSVCLSV